jgi:hypothetical protein
LLVCGEIKIMLLQEQNQTDGKTHKEGTIKYKILPDGKIRSGVLERSWSFTTKPYIFF